MKGLLIAATALIAGVQAIDPIVIKVRRRTAGWTPDR